MKGAMERLPLLLMAWVMLSHALVLAWIAYRHYLAPGIPEELVADEDSWMPRDHVYR